MLSSTIGQLGHPFYVACAWLLAAYFALIPNFAVAIALLTLTVMALVFPITLRSQRAMAKMQVLAPEMKKLQAKYKAPPGLSVNERQELRQRQQEELMALYREHNVSPTGGCLPLLLQFPILIVMYGTIRGLVHQSIVHGIARPDPLYVRHATAIYRAIAAAHGQLVSFGVNLAHSARTSGIDGTARIGLVAIVLVGVVLQYVQVRQMSGRNVAAGGANPQLQQLQKFLPIVLALFYLSIPAGVNLYLIVSSLFRIGQQEFMYRRDPHIRSSMDLLRARTRPA